ncbi:PKD domain-containing protein [Gelidibacter salicanalis]|uniref:PKD domain-containing protein n=1 Tax=Gelidibacter salicanalis TaxID=291193 RepID=A0A934KTJ9_9FLAO|nr:PKD domain-containing protein [Gelidibacter salicanalis]MBJ7881111.1 PKD domain-containing protein [Gelidibacter salicanalis]
MKTVKYIFSLCFIVLAIYSCSQDDDNADFVEAIAAPSNVSASVTVTQDNTGLVTITPTGEGAVSFNVAFGDNSDPSGTIVTGKSLKHIYEEGTYTAIITANGLNGLTTTVNQDIVVSFKAPQNLMVTIENDGTLSKTVNILASADFALSYNVDFGDGSDLLMSNINETTSYTYQDGGTYTITVTAFSAAIETASYTEEFEVTEILQPLKAAPAQPNRAATDVISIYSDSYQNIAGTDFYPNWGQTTTYNEIAINGNNSIQYGNLNYQGIQFGATADASQMEFLHIDVWTADENMALDIFPISIATGEKFVQKNPVAGQWNSYNIPLSDFTSQGLSMADIHQFKFVGTPSGGTVFIDNLYFYKAASGTTSAMIQNFEGATPTFTTFGNIADTQVVANPDASGINTTSKVAKLSKTSGSEVWAGTFFEIASPLDLVSFNKISVKTWSPKVGAVVKLKLENQDASIVHEVDLNTAVANNWEELIYDFSAAPTADYVRIVIFFDFGNAGTGADYYYDQIQLVNNSGASVPVTLQNFEGDAPAFTTFGNIADVEIIANPDASGINMSNKVAQLTKTSGSEVWAGSFFETSTVDLTNYSQIRVKTWSPKRGAVVKLKLENVDASIVHEVDLNTTVANAWEELRYDFSEAPVADYVKVVIFFDFGNVGDGSTYYYDDFALIN